MKNVIVVCDYGYVEGGAANVAVQTAVALAKNTDLNVYFFAGCGEPCDLLKENRIHVVALNMYDLLGNPNKLNALHVGIYSKRAEQEMRKLLNTLDLSETVVHIHTWTKVLTSAVYQAAEKTGVPIFVTVHDYFLACPNGGCFNYKKNEICEFKPLSASCMLSNCDVRHYYHKIWRCARQIRQNRVIRKNKNINYIFISEFEREQLLKRMQVPNRQYLLKNPIYILDRKRIAVEENELFMYIGRLSKEKGVELFCEAATQLMVKSVVIGDGKLASDLKKKYPNIEFTGWLQKEQINEWIKKARCLVFPSLWYEGSPLTVPEVQAYGIPCIITDCSAATDDVENGRNGIIVSSKVSEFVKAMIMFNNDKLAKHMSVNTYAMFDEMRVSEKRYVSELIKIYKKGEV